MLTNSFENLNSTLAVLWLSIICIAVEAIGLFGGFTLFNHGANTFCTQTRTAFHAPMHQCKLTRAHHRPRPATDIICHFCASVLLAWFIMESWHWLTLWYVFGFFSVVPAMVETSAIIRVVFFKVAQY